jgi:tripartite-type tricarboxylate transporter receptor subunit TctC
LRAAAGIKLTHVPFKGNAEAYLALQSGDIQIMSDAIPGAVGPVRTGKVKAISIADDKRSPYLPDLPTAIEQGLPGVIAVGWIGLEAPAKMPAPILDWLNSEMQRIPQGSGRRRELKDLPFIPAGESRAAFAAYIAAEIAKWRAVIQTAGVRID